jgi:ferredoxin
MVKLYQHYAASAIFMICTCIAMHSLLCQLPNCNLFTQHVIYLYGETPLVNYGSQSILLHIYYRLLSTSIIYFLANKYLLPHDTFNPLFTANQWDWEPHCKLGAMYFGCVVCRFHVAANADSVPCQKPASINLQKWFLSPTSRLNLGFTIEGNLPLCSSHLPLGVSSWAASTANSNNFQDSTKEK